MQEQCYALLIDADNVSAKYIKPILTELSKYGIITYKRIYGDWTSTQLDCTVPLLAKEDIKTLITRAVYDTVKGMGSYQL